MAARTGKAKLAGVIGFPVGHSLSPALHEYWLHAYNVDGAYIPLEVPGGVFLDTVTLLSALGFQGANVTLPYKEQAFAMVKDMDEPARLTGAVNTLIRRRDGSFYGRNTDTEGFMESLRHAGVAPETLRHAVILGAGGAARGVVAGLAQAGCAQITVSNRTLNNAEILVQRFREAGCAAELRIQPWEERTKALEGADVLVNTTQLGMRGQPPLEIDLSALPPHAAVMDIVYNPLRTPLLAQAATKGYIAIDGLWMLLYQAAPGFEAWFGIRPHVTRELHDYITSLISP